MKLSTNSYKNWSNDARLPAEDELLQLDGPSRCEHCGNGKVIYDAERAEIVCESCGVVLDLGAEKVPAVRLLRLMPVVPRRLLVDWCRLNRLADIEHAQVDARYTPKLHQLAQQISRIPGLNCKRCGAPIMRKGDRGRFPWYCKPCRAKVDAELVRKTHLGSAGSKRQPRKAGSGAADHKPGGKQLGRRELRALGLSLNPHDL